MAGFSIRTTGELLEVSSAEMFAAATSNVATDMIRAYQPVERATALLAHSRFAEARTIEDKRSFFPLLADMLKTLPTATGIQLGDAGGNYFIVRRTEGTDLLERFEAPAGTRFVVDHVDAEGLHLRWFHDNALEEIGERRLSRSEYDPRIRPWYTAAMDADNTVATDPYVFYFMAVIGMTTAHATTDRQAVVAIDIQLSSMSQALAEQRITPGSVSAIANDEGVIAWSGNQPVIHEREDGTLDRRGLDGLGSPVLDAMARGKRLDGWLMHRVALPLNANIHPELLIAVPSDELLSDLTQIRQGILVVSFLLLMALIPLVWILASRITSPLRELHRAITKVGSGDLDFSLPDVRNRDEVGDLHHALESMRSSLKEHIAQLATATAARERLDSELDIARTIQMDLAPGEGELDTEIDGLDVHARLVPARAVGGDFYEAIQLPDGRPAFVVADVSDKGIPAALFVSRADSMTKLLARRTSQLPDLFASLNRELAADNEACMFMTIFAAVIDVERHTMNFCCGGHNPPVLIRNGQARLIRVGPSRPMGIIDNEQYPETEAEFGPGDRLILYTDGIPEAFNEHGEEFSERRLLAACQEAASLDARGIGAHILKVLGDFVGGAARSDDVTLMVIRYPAADDRS
ncbi:MAG: SpoIIE family protein phosphatase [Xanthomonadales bacterium]|nr:SpoIIE family protein phosphatase [Xanthomonadales bacterium]